MNIDRRRWMIGAATIPAAAAGLTLNAQAQGMHAPVSLGQFTMRDAQTPDKVLLLVKELNNLAFGWFGPHFDKDQNPYRDTVATGSRRESTSASGEKTADYSVQIYHTLPPDTGKALMNTNVSIAGEKKLTGFTITKWFQDPDESGLSCEHRVVTEPNDPAKKEHQILDVTLSLPGAKSAGEINAYVDAATGTVKHIRVMKPEAVLALRDLGLTSITPPSTEQLGWVVDVAKATDAEQKIIHSTIGGLIFEFLPKT
jgi:hypothetical protein